MPPFYSTVVISILFPVAILIGLGILGLLIAITFLFHRNSQRTKMLMQKLEGLSMEIEALRKVSISVVPLREAYLRFIDHISHEVSNPLVSVQINLANMEDCPPEETGEREQYIGIMKQEIKRIFTLTENLRLLSHLERTHEQIKREPVNMKSVVEDVIMAQADRASKKNISLTYQGPNRPAKVLGNRDYLYQVIINLVDNSLKYSKEAGGSIVIKLAEEGKWMNITVSDEGIGIPQEDLGQVFETAYRSPNKGCMARPGSGLGLAIVKRIVEQHEGLVRIDSIFGKGTIVAIDLPIYIPSES
jgi:signal transduction histidine kinase